MKHEWIKAINKDTGKEILGLVCKYCNTRMYGGNVVNVCYKRVEMELKEEVEREKKGKTNAKDEGEV